jgi:hypothetical protein
MTTSHVEMNIKWGKKDRREKRKKRKIQEKRHNKSCEVSKRNFKIGGN